MGDFLYGGSVLANDSCVSSQSLLDTLSINNLLNIKHLTNGSNVVGAGAGGGLSPSVASEPSSNSPNSSSLVDPCDNNNSCQKLGKKPDEQGLLITGTGPMAASNNSNIPTISSAAMSSEVAASVVNTLSSLQLSAAQHSDDDTSTSSLLNGGSIASPIASMNNNNNNPNAANNNLLIENSDLHLSSAAEELSLKGADLSCLGVTSSSSHMVLPPNGGLNFGTTPDHASSPWSTSIDEATSSHLSINGLSAFQNFSSNHLYNGAAVAAAAAAAAAQQQRRAITASHGGFHHGLSPTNTNPNHMLQQQQQQQHPNQSQQQNQFKNSYPTWSNPAPSGPWSQQPQHPQQQQQQPQPNPMNSWNRGRSVPNNMNLGNGLTGSLHGPRKPQHNQALSPYGNHGIHQQQQQQQSQQQQHLQQSLSMAGSNLINSPSKYRRSTSYPGKSGMGGGVGGNGGNNGFGGPLDVVQQLDDSRDPFLSAYQVSVFRRVFFLCVCAGYVTNTDGKAMTKVWGLCQLFLANLE